VGITLRTPLSRFRSGKTSLSGLQKQAFQADGRPEPILRFVRVCDTMSLAGCAQDVRTAAF
jgi:hypothetical protein